MEPMREAPTIDELLRFAAQLPPSQAKRLLGRARPAPLAPEDDAEAERPALVYRSWAQYLADTTAEQRQQWCRAKARTANRARLMSGPARLQDHRRRCLGGSPSRRRTVRALWLPRPRTTAIRPRRPTGAVGGRRQTYRLPRPPPRPLQRRLQQHYEPVLVVPMVQHLADRTTSRSNRLRRSPTANVSARARQA